MRNVLLAIALAVGLVVAAPAQQVVDAVLVPIAHVDVSHIPSISPLVRNGSIICTAWSLNPAGYWVTAAHCVRDLDPGEPGQLKVASLDAKVVAVYAEDDIAVLETVAGVPALPLATQAPVAGDVVHLLGYPLRSKDTLYSRGYVSSPAFASSLWPDEPAMAYFILPACHGHSGSPIGNERFEVISIDQQTLENSRCSSIAIGVTWERLVKAIGGWAQGGKR